MATLKSTDRFSTNRIHYIFLLHVALRNFSYSGILLHHSNHWQTILILVSNWQLKKQTMCGFRDCVSAPIQTEFTNQDSESCCPRTDAYTEHHGSKHGFAPYSHTHKHKHKHPLVWFSGKSSHERVVLHYQCSTAKANVASVMELQFTRAHTFQLI